MVETAAGKVEKSLSIRQARESPEGAEIRHSGDTQMLSILRFFLQSQMRQQRLELRSSEFHQDETSEPTAYKERRAIQDPGLMLWTATSGTTRPVIPN